MEIVRELKTPALVMQATKEGIRSLDGLLKMGKEVPMSEYAKLLIWQKETLDELLTPQFKKDIEKDKKDGWEIESHTWCGEPINEFSIPSLGLYPVERK